MMAVGSARKSGGRGWRQGGVAALPEEEGCCPAALLAAGVAELPEPAPEAALLLLLPLLPCCPSMASSCSMVVSMRPWLSSRKVSSTTLS